MLGTRDRKRALILHSVEMIQLQVIDKKAQSVLIKATQLKQNISNVLEINAMNIIHKKPSCEQLSTERLQSYNTIALLCSYNTTVDDLSALNHSTPHFLDL